MVYKLLFVVIAVFCRILITRQMQLLNCVILRDIRLQKTFGQVFVTDLNSDGRI